MVDALKTRDAASPQAPTARSAEPASAKPRVKRDPARTRDRILKAAIADFSAKGYSGARIESIATRAKSNIRMIYHFYGSKEALYIAALEQVLAQLRAEELKLDIEAIDPVAGLLQLFDFIHSHFAAHPELINLLASENLNRALYLKRSQRISAMASPVVDLIEQLLKRGRSLGTLRRGLDALHVYVTMVALSYFHKSNAHTLSSIFRVDLLDAAWQARHRAQAREMLGIYLLRPR